ncbi:hypothetical protein Kfla_1872 [Kribbella flavida DSM 17836]|uniref:Uncharacterized protein n=1 Tax=Kribbella flavida (strain DSM 17836 / JCM 10339 / NBRC 14399) TaxID=479435 RepID=D2PPK4_KRIFD|nr:hypothetical protein [Kribbella flavida]ADB30966.1 hypothetical protein Kfla_1872 [Kribbella flavida DSM 17836]
MAQYEVIARARLDRRPSTSDYLDLALGSAALDKGMRFVRVDDLPDGRVAVVLQHRLSPRKHDQAAAMANRSLAQLGIPASRVQQIDLVRMSRKGRALVRSWVTPDSNGPGTAGDRAPRTPHPTPPSLQAARDLPTN